MHEKGAITMPILPIRNLHPKEFKWFTKDSQLKSDRARVQA